MAASYRDISGWFDEGRTRGATHMAVYCDTFDHTDYPEFFTGTPDAVREAMKDHGDRLMELYHLGSDKAAQMAERRAHHLDPLDTPATP